MQKSQRESFNKTSLVLWWAATSINSRPRSSRAASRYKSLQQPSRRRRIEPLSDYLWTSSTGRQVKQHGLTRCDRSLKGGRTKSWRYMRRQMGQHRGWQCEKWLKSRWERCCLQPTGMLAVWERRSPQQNVDGDHDRLAIIKTEEKTVK